jgi:hypothetical protein
MNRFSLIELPAAKHCGLNGATVQSGFDPLQRTLQQVEQRFAFQNASSHLSGNWRETLIDTTCQCWSKSLWA